MEDYDKRILSDRRKKPTKGLSRYTFFGRRRTFRRKTDQERGGYTDRYSAGLFFLLILIIGLNILDSFFTMIILDHGGWEVIPLHEALSSSTEINFGSGNFLLFVVL